MLYVDLFFDIAIDVLPSIYWVFWLYKNYIHNYIEQSIM